MVTVNGIVVDARTLPRELQELAWRTGTLPFVPDAHVAQKAKVSPRRSRRPDPFHPRTIVSGLHCE